MKLTLAITAAVAIVLLLALGALRASPYVGVWRSDPGPGRTSTETLTLRRGGTAVDESDTGSPVEMEWYVKGDHAEVVERGTGEKATATVRGGQLVLSEGGVTQVFYRITSPP
jgi:hypothetical protein